MHIAPKNVGYAAYTNSEQVKSPAGIVTSLINASCTFIFEMLGWTVLEVTRMATVRIFDYISANFKMRGTYINGKYGWEYT
jgi:hypothetical protein